MSVSSLLITFVDNNSVLVTQIYDEYEADTDDVCKKVYNQPNF